MSYKSGPRCKKYKLYSSDIWGNFFKRRKSFKGLPVFLARIWRKKTLRTIEVNPAKLRKRRPKLRARVFKIKQRVKLFFFNLKEYQFRTILRSALKKKRTGSHAFLRHLTNVFESRVDSILQRTNCFPSVYYIRFFIRMGGVRVNGIVRTSPHFQCKLWDKITLTEKYLPLLKARNKLKLRAFRRSPRRYKKVLLPTLAYMHTRNSSLSFKVKDFSFRYLAQGPSRFFFKANWSHISGYYRMLK